MNRYLAAITKAVRRIDLLQKIEERNEKGILEIIEGISDHQEAATLIAIILRGESSSKLINRVLEVFFGLKGDTAKDHLNWTHATRKFTEELWKQRMIYWIKKLSKACFEFKGNHVLASPYCTKALAVNFVKHSNWNDNPKDFYLCSKNLTCLQGCLTEYEQVRLAAKDFSSEKEFLVWKFELYLIEYKEISLALKSFSESVNPNIFPQTKERLVVFLRRLLRDLEKLESVLEPTLFPLVKRVEEEARKTLSFCFQ